MHFRILGPLEVEDGPAAASGSAGISSALSSRSSCCARTKWCRSTRSSKSLWGAEPPASATKSVHALISKLRRMLEGEAADDANGDRVTTASCSRARTATC